MPLFDQAEYLHQPIPSSLQDHLSTSTISNINEEHYLLKRFLLSYEDSHDTFTSYRREVERLAQWAWFVHNKGIQHLQADDIRTYIRFAQSPPDNWIMRSHCVRFKMNSSGQRVPESTWRPYLLRCQHKRHALHTPQYVFSSSSLRALLASVSTLYTFLLHEGYVNTNPLLRMRQKNRLLPRIQQKRVTRRLSDIQWQQLVKSIYLHASKNPSFTRTVFIFNAFYLLGLRISELADSELGYPKMSDFFQDKNKLWWFATVGKGNKYREVAVPDAMLSALTSYRCHLGMSPYPSPDDTRPLLGKLKGHGPIGIRQLRKIVQHGFDLAITSLEKTDNLNEAESMRRATVHWLRHTAISNDVENRPKEHVRDDAGHSSTITTDGYSTTREIARHQSAQTKKLLPSNTCRGESSHEL